MRHSPAPNAPAAPMSVIAKARDPEGISSAATTTTSNPPAVASPRTTVCATPSATRSGAKLLSAATRQPSPAQASRTRRRPLRSASAVSASAPRMPMRTAASVAPCWVLVASNSSAANVIVWLRSVPM